MPIPNCTDGAITNTRRGDMSNAFKCGIYGNFYEGKPFEKIFNEHYTKQVANGPEHPKRAELCEECSREFAGGPPNFVE